MSKQNHKNKHQSNQPMKSRISNDLQKVHETKELDKPQDIQGQDMPSYGEIEILAYQIHEEKGGSDLDNWLEAERMLKERH